MMLVEKVERPFQSGSEARHQGTGGWGGWDMRGSLSMALPFFLNYMTLKSSLFPSLLIKPWHETSFPLHMA